MASSLDLLQNQPIRFGYSPETCANNDNRDYCNLVQDGDIIYAQVRRTMGTSLGCSLLDVSATEDVLNPLFVNNTAWTFSGGFAWNAASGGIARITAATGSVSQNLITPVDKALYKIVVTTITQLTTSATGVDMNVDLSGVTIGIILKDSLAGAYTFYGILDSGTPSIAIASTGGNITVDVSSIEVLRAAPCYTFDVDPASTFSYSEISGISINGTVSVVASLPFEPSSTYSPHIIIDVTNYNTGTVEYFYDGAASGAITASNGEMTYTMNSSGFDVFSTGFLDFIGTISDINFEQYSSDYFFSLNDLDGTFVQSLNQFVVYCREWVTLRVDLQAEGFSYGCYKIGLYDPYLHTDIIEYSYDFTTIGGLWPTSSGAWAYIPSVGFGQISIGGSSLLETTETAIDFTAAWIKVMYETGTVSGPGIGATQAGIQIENAFGVIIASSSTAISDTIYRNVTEGDAITVYDNTGGINPGITVDGATATDSIVFQNAFYKVYPYHQDYLSNCFTYSETVPCSKLIYAFPGENLGFNSTCSFAIVKRLRAVRIIPSYKVTSSDFIGSDGTRTLISGSGQKIYTILFDYMDELSHDVIMTLLLCKVVWVGDTLLTVATNDNRYFLIPQDYTPEWDKDGKLNLAMGRIQAIQFNQVKFTTNCQ